MDEEERIRQWKLQLQQEMADDDDDDDDNGLHDLIAKHRVPLPQHFDDEPLSDEDEPGGRHTGPSSGQLAALDDDLGLDLEEPAYRDKAPPHLTTFELPKGIATKKDYAPDGAALAATQGTVDALQAALRERDIELDRLRRAAAEDVGASDGPGDLRDQRLRELARKNRHMVQLLGKERATFAALSGELAALKAHPPSAAASAASSKVAAPSTSRSATATPLPGGGGGDDSLVVRELRDKLALAQGKANEARLTQQAMRAELSKYQRALAKEVGDDVPLAKVLEDGWRGRAQQITLLKAKLGDARRTGGAGAEDGHHHQLSAVDERARAQIASKEGDRRREFERLVLREQEQQAVHAELAAKLEPVLARVRILESEGRANREKLKMLLTKSDNDDELVQALKEQLRRASEMRKAATTVSQVPSLVTAESGSALAELAAEREELARQNSRQEQIIVFLRDQLARATVVRESESARSLPPPHDLRHLEVENSKLRELCQLLQDKLTAAARATAASSSRASSSHGRPHVA
ncbi:hypothetical protein T492DRAFT_978984 [Pavlovales sp. CCMP2436]|nr:hypothetical protein T492DRAFT_978984 [Pavlovales sp. CCMP2436]